MARGGLAVRDFRSFISRPKDVFGYFDTQLGGPDWAGHHVFDFGGNVGNLLVGSPIEPDRYWCVDVSLAAIEEGRKRFPAAHWVHYDRYNFQYNPDGHLDEPIPVLGPRFDYIFCFSVFTHTTPTEMLDLVGQLRSQLAPTGSLLFTFNDLSWAPPGDDPSARMRAWLERAENPHRDQIDVDAFIDAVRGADWLTLVDDSELYVERDGLASAAPRGTQYVTAYRSDYLRTLLPGARILEPVIAHTHQQHCAVLGAP